MQNFQNFMIERSIFDISLKISENMVANNISDTELMKLLNEGWTTNVGNFVGRTAGNAVNGVGNFIQGMGQGWNGTQQQGQQPQQNQQPTQPAQPQQNQPKQPTPEDMKKQFMAFTQQWYQHGGNAKDLFSLVKHVYRNMKPVNVQPVQQQAPLPVAQAV